MLVELTDWLAETTRPDNLQSLAELALLVSVVALALFAVWAFWYGRKRRDRK